MKYIFPFPFEQIPKGSAVVIYGARFIGREYLAQVQEKKCYELMYVVDKNYEQIEGMDVVSPKRLMDDTEFDFVVIASFRYVDSIYMDLIKLGVPEDKIVSAFCLKTKSYADYCEDYIVSVIFKLLGKEKFSYIDVGANDPYKSNNTAYLYINGCRGINVEANPDLIDKLRNERPEDIVINCGVGVSAGTFPYFMFENSALNTFSEKVTEARKSAGIKVTNVMQIPMLTLSEIIDRYANGKWPDFLSIDIEGLDYEVLDSCDFSRDYPLVICAEIAGGRAVEILDKKGFVTLHRTSGNTIAVHKKIMQGVLI
jgi:FkbM family methyltransferase